VQREGRLPGPLVPRGRLKRASERAQHRLRHARRAAPGAVALQRGVLAARGACACVCVCVCV
jgi:hypothetical protein